MASSIFIAGATGNQGRPLALQLRKEGWAVRTTSRDPEGPAAKSLAAAGVEVLRGEWDNVQSLESAMSGCKKLFFTMVAYIDDPERELRQAHNIVQASKAAGVEQVVVSTSVGVATYGSCPHASFYETVMRIKKATEEAVRDGGFESYAVLRPALFMTNLLAPQVDYFFPGFRETGVCQSAMMADTQAAFLDTSDVAKIALVVLNNADKYNGRAIGVASQLLTIPQMLEKLETATGRSLEKPKYLSEEEIDSQKDSFCFTVSERSLRWMAKHVDMDELAAMGASLSTLEGFFDQNKEALKQTYEKLPVATGGVVGSTDT